MQYSEVCELIPWLMGVCVVFDERNGTGNVIRRSHRVKYIMYRSCNGASLRGDAYKAEWWVTCRQSGRDGRKAMKRSVSLVLLLRSA